MDFPRGAGALDCWCINFAADRLAWHGALCHAVPERVFADVALLDDKVYRIQKRLLGVALDVAAKVPSVEAPRFPHGVSVSDFSSSSHSLVGGLRNRRAVR